MSKNSTIILGGQGMLGQDLAQVFASEQPVVWGRRELDITNRAEVAKKISRARPAVVLNAAAYNLVDEVESAAGFTAARKVNAIAPAYLAAACARVNATLVHFSTDYVFAGDRPGGYNENDQPNPQSKYGLTKREGELAVLDAGGGMPSGRGAKFYVVRTCRLFGCAGTGANVKKSFVDLMLELGDSREQLNVVDTELASPTYTPDLARQTKWLLDEQYEPGIYHVTNSGSCTWYGFAQEIFNIWHKLHPKARITRLQKIGATVLARPAPRPQYSVLINTKLPPLRSWPEALEEFLRTK